MEETTYDTILYPAYSGPMVKTYPFTLDPFQQVSITCLEHNESVILSAHTSAGKIAVVEYAIAMEFRDKKRVIYMSPLKALRNQKYRELSHEFADVGLMTSDVSMSLNVSCLVMTMNILRGMLYRGFEVLKEVSWVIFDKIHYMKDRERVVVWEESIIFLHPAIKMVFLLATMSREDMSAIHLSVIFNLELPCTTGDTRCNFLRNFYGIRGFCSATYIILIPSCPK